ncbi:UDP-N-acetylmuramoyl-L-alanyl-D-glutamate--2,6-diaminopimelate ligase [Halobacillus massiliensis]|uniref:UDP-N-acetylmuramoyl-L-alanyl-D-glutamate--2, 6-diaminopimelate ligase n=1 Tax=Halobacillus massiliensis TaxID=1926286 RepID=UPI0009E386B7|nr:UDP-N-acetylmuramoyl-L-alanyl-D-glutamate--2,6-diaminopimelate ligase [Halobacillus massiliensis]
MKKMVYNFSDLWEASVYGPESQTISSIVYDSRDVMTHSAFVCIKGEHQNGHRFIDNAVERGASVIIGTENELLHTKSHLHSHITFIAVTDSKLAMAELSSLLYDSPSRELFTVGVTGTNGKTTVTSFIYSLLNALSYKTGSIGTAGIWDDKEKKDFKQTVPTTPESPDLQHALQYYRDNDLQAAIIESTSIAIAQQRLATIDFDIAVHTNLTPEHLDFHGTIENYKKAKLQLFSAAKQAVVNLDDTGMARDILKLNNGPIITYGFHPEADIRAEKIGHAANGTSLALIFNNKKYYVQAPLFGEYNVSNLLAAIATCHLIGFTIDDILSVIYKIKSPEGRYQIIQNHTSFTIIMDYAHTPDALTQVLQSVRERPYNKLIVMITGIGLRDPNKRPIMAQCVEGLADEIIVSVDQPGFADRHTVVTDVLKGFKKPEASNIHTALYREEGIHLALSLASKGDTVLLTGIGFGGYQIIEDQKVPYSEEKVIQDFFDIPCSDLPVLNAK